MTSEARAAVRGSSGAGEAQSLPGRMAAPRPELSLADRVYMPAEDLAWAPVMCEAKLEDGTRCTNPAAAIIEARNYCGRCANAGRRA